MPKKIKPPKYLNAVFGKVGSGKCSATFTNGLKTTNLMTAQFFMAMQEYGKSIEEVRAYIKIGPTMHPAADWSDIARIAEGF